MKSKQTLLKNWGNYPAVDSQVFSPDNKAEIQDFVKNETRLIARGNGKCYGDAALAPKVLSTLSLNSILDFDSETGIIHCEAGVLLREILDRVVPAGWFFYVTPGIKNITVGGAVASDVHGKNHPTHNCFSHYLKASN
ncbi:MAG: FAD-binding protein [Saprospiraceae bacterium]